MWQISGNEASLALPPLANHRGPVYGVAANFRNQLATSGGDGTVKIWEVGPEQNRLLRTLAATGITGALELRGVDLSVELGRTHILAGENGAGKSTLLHMLSGFLAPSSGTVNVLGEAAIHFPKTGTNFGCHRFKDF